MRIEDKLVNPILAKYDFTRPTSRYEACHHLRPTAPSKAETSKLQPFEGLPLDRIFVPRKKGELLAAAEEIQEAKVVGFDTESKPVFKISEANKGPHVVQFALETKAFLFQTHLFQGLSVLRDLLTSEELGKVGFGLNSDRRHIRNKLGIKMRSVVDLDVLFRQRGYKGSIGIRAATAIVLNQKFHKSKKITTSNWASPNLSEGQLKYAANDAFAALMIFRGLELQQQAPSGAELVHG